VVVHLLDYRKEMFRITDIYLLIGFLMIFIVIMWFGVVHGQNATNSTLDQMCFQMYHLDNWTLGYLRSLAAYCSNGGQ
jgi:hypothetical protein